MHTQHIAFDIPGDILIALNNNINEFKRQMRIYTAMKVYELGKLSLGKAAKLSGLSYWDFSISRPSWIHPRWVSRIAFPWLFNFSIKR